MDLSQREARSEAVVPVKLHNGRAGTQIGSAWRNRAQWSCLGPYELGYRAATPPAAPGLDQVCEAARVASRDDEKNAIWIVDDAM